MIIEFRQTIIAYGSISFRHTWEGVLFFKVKLKIWTGNCSFLNRKKTLNHISNSLPTTQSLLERQRLQRFPFIQVFFLAHKCCKIVHSSKKVKRTYYLSTFFAFLKLLSFKRFYLIKRERERAGAGGEGQRERIKQTP